MAKVTAKNCPKCGAPLALQRGVSDLPCQYCGTVVHVEWDKKPPANPQPQQMATIYVAPSMPAFVPVLIALGLLLLAAIGYIVYRRRATDDTPRSMRSPHTSQS